VNPKADAPKATIAREGDQLTIMFPSRPGVLALVPVSETEFDIPFTDGHFTFNRDTEGRGTGVLLRVGDGERAMGRAAL
jgi:hypothetical protein